MSLEVVPKLSIAKSNKISIIFSLLNMLPLDLANDCEPKTLGKGSFGRVVLSRLGEKQVAVKVCGRDCCECDGEKTSLLVSHPNIAQTYQIYEFQSDSLDLVIADYIISVGLSLDHFRRFGLQLIVMELAGSQSLQQLLDDGQQEINSRRCYRLAHQIALALRHCHDKQVVHMDVKPANVMVTTNDVCKLVDFGSSRRLDIDHECRHDYYNAGKQSPSGTALYTAPEIFINKLVSPKADIYSFGITMWQMVTRLIPFADCETHSLIYRVVSSQLRPPLHSIGANKCDLDYVDLMVNCWHHDYHQRPSSFELCQRLSHLLTK